VRIPSWWVAKQLGISAEELLPYLPEEVLR
jgi:hypothetical protein